MEDQYKIISRYYVNFFIMQNAFSIFINLLFKHYLSTRQFDII